MPAALAFPPSIPRKRESMRRPIRVAQQNNENDSLKLNHGKFSIPRKVLWSVHIESNYVSDGLNFRGRSAPAEIANQKILKPHVSQAA
jgi:hypothetical protein